MDDWFSTLAESSELAPDQARELDEHGFVVLPGPVPVGQMDRLARAYDAAVASAAGDDVRTGSTTTRVTDFVNRGAEFDDLYVFPPLLEACCRIIGRPFKLSSMHARTLRPCSVAQKLHVDVRRDSADWPLVGFILMIDEFRPDNGATRFVRGSHRWPGAPEDIVPAPRDDYEGQVLACGPAGSLIIFDGSTWHGHTANTSAGPRRSLQGAFIPQDGRAGTDFAARMSSETRARLGPVARYVLQDSRLRRSDPMRLDIYVNYRGSCEQAFRFYEQHLGGRITGMVRHGEQPNPSLPADWQEKVLHARIEIGTTVLMGADIPQAEAMRSAYLTLSLDREEDADRIYVLLAEGGEIFMKLEKTPFANRFAMLRDRFGTSWMLLHQPESP